MAEEAKKKTSGGRKIAVIAAIVALLLINAIQLYLRYSEKNAYEQEIDSNREEIAKAMNSLDSVEFELKQRLATIEELGGEKDSLIAALAEISDLKEKAEKNAKYWYGQKKKLDDKLEGFKILLANKDKEIEKLQAQNEILLSENQGLKQEKMSLSENISDLEGTKKQLEQKVNIASKLKAENIEIRSIDRRGNISKDKRGSDLKASKLEKLRVRFNIAENKVAKVETKIVYLQVIEPDGTILYDLANGGGTFIMNGKERFFTLKQDFLFDNRKPQIEFLYIKGSDWVEGQYKVELYCEEVLIGEAPFLVK
ncbi:MAG: chromosome segregation protein SMC [Cytophagales bacterium]